MPVTNRLLMLLVFGLVVPLTLLGEAPTVTGIFPQPVSPGLRAAISGAGLGRDATVLVGGRPTAVLGYEKEAVGGYIFETLTVDPGRTRIPRCTTRVGAGACQLRLENRAL